MVNHLFDSRKQVVALELKILCLLEGMHSQKVEHSKHLCWAAPRKQYCTAKHNVSQGLPLVSWLASPCGGVGLGAYDGGLHHGPNAVKLVGAP